jgi:hypothetical protein
MKNNVVNRETLRFFVICKYLEHEQAFKFPLLFSGDPMFCGDGPIPEDRAVREEGGLHPRLHLPAAQRHACEPRAGRRLRHDAGSGMGILERIFSGLNSSICLVFTLIFLFYIKLFMIRLFSFLVSRIFFLCKDY